MIVNIGLAIALYLFLRFGVDVGRDLALCTSIISLLIWANVDRVIGVQAASYDYKRPWS